MACTNAGETKEEESKYVPKVVGRPVAGGADGGPVIDVEAIAGTETGVLPELVPT